MQSPKRQLYILCDLEGASGISPGNRGALLHGSELWRSKGRDCITSDMKAVCEAADEYGVDEIILNDSHDNGHRVPNVLMRDLPDNVRLVRRPYLPGKPRHMVRGELLGMIIVGQHAMYGGGGFTPHTICSPPFGEVTINGLKVGEIGIELALFIGSPLLAIVGEQAAVDEAKALCPNVVGVAVKSLEAEWFPQASETFPLIRSGILDALHRRDEMSGLEFNPPFRFTLKPTEERRFRREKRFPLHRLTKSILFGRCCGEMSESIASWETKTIIGGLYILQGMRGFIEKRDRGQ